MGPVREKRLGDSKLYLFFKEVFLPEGYPQSVRADYATYQIWDSAQVLLFLANFFVELDILN